MRARRAREQRRGAVGRSRGGGGRQWRIEGSSEGLTGLDEHPVRRWRSWRRWTLLVTAAHAVLSIATLTARERDRQAAEHEGLTPLTGAEIRRPAAADADLVAAWSRWRRRHQRGARTSDDARRGQLVGNR